MQPSGTNDTVFVAFRMAIYPLERTIRTEDPGAVETAFSGSTTCEIDHEMKHLAGRETRGEELMIFRFG